MTRYEKKIQEIKGESAWQFLLQMSFFLHIIKLSESQVIKKTALELSVFISLLSIINGQIKVNIKTNLFLNQAQKLNTQFSSSFLQSVIYILASIGEFGHI